MNDDRKVIMLVSQEESKFLIELRLVQIKKAQAEPILTSLMKRLQARVT